MLELLPLIIELLIGVAISVIGYLLKNMIDGMDSKLSLILTNQQKQEVIIAEIKKDVETTKKIADKSEEEITYLRNKVHEIDKDLSSLIMQWKNSN